MDNEVDELAQLADELVDQIAAARRHYADLRAAIDGSAAAAEALQHEQVAVAEEEPAEPEQPGYRRTPEEEAEIVALSMALTGGGRHEAHLHLVDTFGIYDTDEILDRAFGASQAKPSPVPRRRFGRLRR